MSSPRLKDPLKSERKEGIKEEEKQHKESLEYYIFQTQKCHFAPCFTSLPLFISELYRLWSISTQPFIAIAEQKNDSSIQNKSISDETASMELKEQPITHYNYLLPIDMIEMQSFAMAINNKNIHGLANLLVISFFLEQTDLNTQYLGFVEGHGFINWNFDHAFYSKFNTKSYNPNHIKPITKENLIKLPELYFNNASLTLLLSKHPDFVSEFYATILKIIITPLESIYKLIDIYFNEQEIEKSRQELILKDYSKRVAELTDLRDIFSGIKQSLSSTFSFNKTRLELESLLMSEFRQFLFNHAGILDKEFLLFVDFLKQFDKNTERNNSIDNKLASLSSPERLMTHVLENLDCSSEYKEQFINEMVNDAIQKKVGSPEKFEKIILENKEISIAFKKQAIHQIITYSIQQATQLSELDAIAKKLDTDKLYEIIKQRSGYTSFSFWGYNHNGEPVSKTFSDLMGAIKKRMREIGNPSNLKDYQAFLGTHRTSGYWGSSPILQHIRNTFTSHDLSETKEGECKPPI